MQKKIKLRVLPFFFLLFSTLVWGNPGKELRDLRGQFRAGKISFHTLKSFVFKQDSDDLSDRVKEIFSAENSAIKKFEKILIDDQNLAKTWMEFVNEAQAPYYNNSFRHLLPISLYLFVYLKQKKMAGHETLWPFEQVLIFLVERMSFRYAKAKEVTLQIKSTQMREHFKVIIKRFAELEYRGSKAAESTPEVDFFLK